MVVETYHKIQTLFKRHLDGPKKGKMIRGDWTTPELEYLSGNEWEFTEKVDGTNIRIGYIKQADSNKIAYRGRSDNAQVPKPLAELLNEYVYNLPFHETFLDIRREVPIILFGEGYGPNIQGGGKYRDDVSFVLFDVKIGDWWLNRASIVDIAGKLGIEYVPLLGTGTLQDAIDIVSTGLTWDKNGRMVNWGLLGGASNSGRFNGLKSQWGDFEAEGIVARPAVPMFDRKGQRIITKIKAVDFR